MGEPSGRRLGDFLLGIEGLAILRRWRTDPDAVSDRVSEMAEIVQALHLNPFSELVDAPARGVAEGYESWSETYDEVLNPLLEAEFRALCPVLDSLEPGIVLDAACGTGRHSSYLAQRGHKVIGIDVSGHMLAKARPRGPEIRLCQGDLLYLPLANDSVDAAVCALALTHLSDLGPPISELARVVRKGGRIVISDIHPVTVAVGGHALYKDARGRLEFIRNHLHWHSSYFRAFRDAGLLVKAMSEQPYRASELATFRSHQVASLASDIAIGDLPVVLVWDVEVGGSS